MIMKHLHSIGILLFVAGVIGTSTSASAQSESPEQVIHRFFQAMADIDTTYLNHIMLDDASLSSSYRTPQGSAMGSITKTEFIQSIASAPVGKLNEQIANMTVQRDDGLATVWMDYSFYLGDTHSHCGVNTFTLMSLDDEWYISAISDSRRKSDCKIHDIRILLDSLLTQWHAAAARADSTSFFDMMTTDAIYVGTDQSEVWPKRRFLEFAAPYFQRGKAWAFTTISRNIYTHDYTTMAWFDEMLDTWMGPCRGSGVLVHQDGVWKIQHYVLSVTVPNEDIQKFIDIGN